MKKLLGLLVLLCALHSNAQSYTTTIDTFYVPTPEYSSSLGLDSLYFPSAITTPTSGTNFPVLILIHGSSAVNMDSHSTKDFLDSVGATVRKAETRLFYEIADSLSRNGIMVLRYDKRSFTVNCIEKPQCWFVDTITPYAYIKDAQYAVNFAKSLPDVDTCNIFVAGHSQGGSFAPAIGLWRNDIQGSISLAPTAQPIDSVVFYQTEFLNSDPAGANILREQFDSLRMGTWPMSDTLYNQFFSPKFWLNWLQITDSAITTQQALNIPTLIMYGTLDAAVPHNTHLTLWQDSITRPNFTTQLFDSLDHAFGTPYDSTVFPAALDYLTQWIHANSQNCGTSDFNTNVNEFITLYPNPIKAGNLVHVLSSQKIETIELYDANGREISLQVQENSFSTLNLVAGVYFIKIRNTSGVAIRRLIVH